MDSSASSLTLDFDQILPQSDSASPIRLAAEDPRSSIVGLLREIESKVTTALRFFGVDIRFFPKFVHNLRGAVRPACIAAVSCFVVLHLFPTIGVCAVGGVVFLVHLSVSRARLEMMRENLEAAKQAGAEMKSGTAQLEEQNAELLRLNMAQVTTIDEQKATIEGAQQNLETAKSELSAAQANLGLELQLKELQERQSVEQKRLIAQQQAQLREHEAYIAQCQSCLASVFTSHQELIQNLQLSLEVQTKTVNQILQNVHSIANGEQKLTDALGWAQGRIAEAQAKLTAVINISAEVTDREKCKELIENGEFAQKAQVMHQAAQEAHQLMNELSTGLTTRILEAQQAIAANRKQAEVQLRTLTSQQQKTKHDLRNANAQIKKRQQEIARLDAEHEAALKRVGKTNTAQIQTLEAEIAREKQSLDALAKEKGSLARNLQRARRTCRELQEKVNSLSLSNDTLQKQCQMQEQTLKEQQETIESQRQSLETVQTSLEHLQLQAQSSGWLQTAAAVVGGALGMALLR